MMATVGGGEQTNPWTGDEMTVAHVANSPVQAEFGNPSDQMNAELIGSDQILAQVGSAPPPSPTSSRFHTGTLSASCAPTCRSRRKQKNLHLRARCRHC